MALVPFGSSFQPDHLLFDAAASGDEAAVRSLLDEDGQLIVAKNTNGLTALHLSIQHGHESAARVLLEHGADPNALTKESRNPLFLAVDARALEIVKLLLGYHAGIESRDNDGKTPLHRACELGLASIAELLIEYGASVTAETPIGHTPLSLSIPYTDLFKILLARGASPDVRLNDGSTIQDLSRDNPAVAEHLAAHVFLEGPRIRPMDGNGNAKGKEKEKEAEKEREGGHSTRTSAVHPPSANDVDKLNACRGFEATVVLFFVQCSERRLEITTTVYELLYGKGPEGVIQEKLETVDGIKERPTFTWFHLPANNMPWVEALFTRLFAHHGDSPMSDERFKLLMGLPTPKQRQRSFKRPSCQEAQVSHTLFGSSALHEAMSRVIEAHQSPEIDQLKDEIRQVCEDHPFLREISAEPPDGVDLFDHVKEQLIRKLLTFANPVVTFTPFLNYENYPSFLKMERALKWPQGIPPAHMRPPPPRPPGGWGPGFMPPPPDERRLRFPWDKPTVPTESGDQNHNYPKPDTETSTRKKGRHGTTTKSWIRNFKQKLSTRFTGDSHGDNTTTQSDSASQTSDPTTVSECNEPNESANDARVDNKGNDGPTTQGVQGPKPSHDNVGFLGKSAIANEKPSEGGVHIPGVTFSAGATGSSARGEGVKQTNSRTYSRTNLTGGKSGKTLNLNEHLVRGYLTHRNSGDIPLQPRRTLDQYLYGHIDTSSRDRDQVVFRWMDRWTEYEPKLFMVDQLWMWTFDQDMVVSCCPLRWHAWRSPQPHAAEPRHLPGRWSGLGSARSWGMPPPPPPPPLRTAPRKGPPPATELKRPVPISDDPMDVRQSVLKHLHDEHRDPVRTVYDLADLVASSCASLFHGHSLSDEFQFFEFFQSSIAHVTVKATRYQDTFREVLKEANQDRKFRSMDGRFEDPAQDSHHICDVSEDTELLVEIDDILDELYILKMVITDQKKTLEQMRAAFRQAAEKAKDRTPDYAYSPSAKYDAMDRHLAQIGDMEVLAWRARQSVSNLMDMKLKQANFSEAVSSRVQAAAAAESGRLQAIQATAMAEQAKEAAKQGKTIMAFTVVTLLFLPLSFMAAFLAIEIDEFPVTESGRMPLGYALKYLLSIGIAVFIPFVFLAFNVDKLQAWLRAAYEKMADDKRYLVVSLILLLAIIVFPVVWTSSLAATLKVGMTIATVMVLILVAVIYMLVYGYDRRKRRGGSLISSSYRTSTSSSSVETE